MTGNDIPEMVQIGGQFIRIERKKNLMENCDCWGRWTPEQNLIEVQAQRKNICPAFLKQVFLHEIMHAILDIYGYAELSKNEELVDVLAQGVHQVLT